MRQGTVWYNSRWSSNELDYAIRFSDNSETLISSQSIQEVKRYRMIWDLHCSIPSGVAVINRPAPIVEVHFVHQVTSLEVEQFAPALGRYVRPIVDRFVQKFLREINSKPRSYTNSRETVRVKQRAISTMTNIALHACQPTVEFREQHFQSVCWIMSSTDII